MEMRRLSSRHGALPPEEVWPCLRVISCWTSAGAVRFVPELRRLFPRVEIQPKGLLATEGVVSIPMTGHPGAALAVTSHFLEFREEAAPGARPRLVDELEPGRTYTVLLTTGGGLYRYALGDRVRVVGLIAETPLIEFVGKEAQICDLCGEKLHEERVRAVLDGALQELRIEPVFAMIAPEWGLSLAHSGSPGGSTQPGPDVRSETEGRPPGYVLFLEAADLAAERFEALLRRVEAGLAEGHHYAYCRRLSQLAPLRGFRIRGGASQAYQERGAALGQRRGSIKPAALHREPGWEEWFDGQPFSPGYPAGGSVRDLLPEARYPRGLHR
jgi:hypothetical protein